MRGTLEILTNKLLKIDGEKGVMEELSQGTGLD
jgi:hypothetical protein